MDIERLKSCFERIGDFKRWLHLGANKNHYEFFGVVKEYMGTDLLFIIQISKNFPNAKPDIFFLRGHSVFGDIPHLMPSDAICYVDEEGILIDEDNPAGVIRDAFRKAFDTLVKSLKGESERDYVREFQYYWGGSGSIVMTSFVGDAKTPKLVQWLVAGDGRNFVFEDEQQSQLYLPKFDVVPDESLTRQILYLPLSSSRGISFKDKWTIGILRKVIFGNIGFKERVNRCLRADSSLPVYITIPTENSSRVHFAVSFENVNAHKHPLLDKKCESEIKPIIVKRMDKDYLLPRGGARKEISNKKVCVIGCGAIGGIVAVELAKAGISALLLIDPDRFSEDNLYRHVLGMNDGIGQSKVDCLKKMIESKLPHSTLTAISKRFDEVVDDGKVDFNEYDVVIDATGKPNVGFQIARYFVSQHSKRLPVIHGWLEPLGIGGHVVVSNQKDGGCYKCLFRRTEEGSIYNGASFAAPGQSFSKSMFGCVGMFTPFSSLDAMKTAVMIVEASVKVLIGRENKSQLLSWKGEAEDFLAQGFALSNRYNNLTADELFERRYEFINEHCPLCTKETN